MTLALFGLGPNGTIALVFTICCFGLYWWWFFLRGQDQPTVVVRGIYPSGPYEETRELPIHDGMVRWDHGEDSEDVEIALDGKLSMPTRDQSHMVVYADVERGIQFSMDLPPEGVEYQVETDDGRVGTKRIDGRILAAKRDDMSVSMWRQTRAGWREQFLAYTPWILGILAVMVMGILYYLIRYVPVSEPQPIAPGGGGNVRDVSNALMVLWLARPWRVA